MAQDPAAEGSWEPEVQPASGSEVREAQGVHLGSEPLLCGVCSKSEQMVSELN